MRYHGLLLVDKPQGITSHDVVHQVRKKLGISDVGHCGTLDPLATGLMVVLLGEATKLSQFLLEQDKAYVVTLKLGVITDTWDTTGKIISENLDVNKSLTEVLQAAEELKGLLEFPVPIYSAIKVQGKKLYEQARKGELIEAVPIRPMIFHEVNYLASPDKGEYQFFLKCSKGSYIRSWVYQLGQKLGCGAVMSALRRTESAPYNVDRAVSIDSITKLQDLNGNHHFITMTDAVDHFKTVRVKWQSESLIRNGQISHELKRQIIAVYEPEKDQGIKVMTYFPEELLALIVHEPGKGFMVRRVFRY
jgi:tRNA pseudouridine55 synthase